MELLFGCECIIYIPGIHTYLNNYHAEMQVLQFFLDHNLRPDPPYMGVSKPCCPECSEVLTRAGIQFAESHTRNCHAIAGLGDKVGDHPASRDDLKARLGPLFMKEAPF
jgi:hypothetical protein